MHKRYVVPLSVGVIGLLVALVLSFTAVIHATAASSAVNLGTAGNFSVLAGTTVTNTGSTSMNADLGLSPGSSVTGAPVSAAQHVDDPTAVQAKTDLTAAYVAAQGLPSTATIPDAGDIGGQTLTPGVYSSASSIFITGTLTLDGGGDPNAQFVFQAGSTVITASDAKVVLVNGAQACNVTWAVGSSATLGTGTQFVGNVLALTSITDTTGTHTDGSLLAQNGAVTLDTDTINTQPCSAGTTTTATVPVTTTTTTTAPVTTTTSPSPPATTTTVNTTTTGPCGCGPTPGHPITRKPVVIKPITVPPNKVVTVKLPAPGCGCITVPGAKKPPVVKYVVTHIDKKHCKDVSINQRTGKLKVKITKPGKYKIVLTRGKQKVTVPMTCKPKG